MKIAKNKPIKAADAEVENPQTAKYTECIKHIREAIDCLTNDAKNDDIAREALNNLSVILFDLQD